MEKTKRYEQTRFTADVVREALTTFRAQFDPKTARLLGTHLTATVDDAEWGHDSIEEFFADYRRSNDRCTLVDGWVGYSLRVDAFATSAIVEVRAPSRGEIETVYHVLDRHVAACRIPEPPQPLKPPPPPPSPPVVFIGHGGNPLWRDLRDHLQDKHGYEVEAYEIGARAGLGISEVLRGMLGRASIALLVMTGEDEMADGRLLARQNVVHEIGLFQGRLGWSRAIVLLEKGTEDFSNLQGINQIRFNSGAISETYGDVLAALKREFFSS